MKDIINLLKNLVILLENISLNTSFNNMGEPIVNTPSEAIKCFYDSGIDALFLGNYLITK